MYFLRQRKSDVAPLSPTCSLSSGDTCPALAGTSPGRLLLVCKRSFKSTASSANSVISSYSSSSDFEWFVDDATQTPGLLRKGKRRRSERRISIPVFSAASSNSALKRCPSSRSCYSLTAEDGTPKAFLAEGSTWSPRSLSPSPPHLQPATPLPPTLDNAEVSDIDVKPLTVTIKRLGPQLYCIPSTPENLNDNEEITIS